MGIPLAALAINQNQPSPAEQMGKVLQLKALQQQQQYQAQAQPLELQQRQQQIEAEKRKIADEDAATKAMNQWTSGSLEDLPDLIRKNGGSFDAVMGAHKAVYAQREQLSKIAEQDATTGSKNIETYQKKADQVAGELAGAKDIPDAELPAWALGKVQSLAQAGVMDMPHAQHLTQQIQQDPDPAQIREGLDHYTKGIQGASALAKAAQEAETSRHNKAMEGKTPTTEASLAERAATGDPEATKAIAILDKSKRESRPVNITQNTARSDKSYQFESGQLEKVAAPIDQLAQRMGRLQDTIAQNTPQADALVAPELLTVMAGGMGSGLRMNEAEIVRIVGGRSKWESLKANVNKWSLDPKAALSITPEQRQEIRALVGEVAKKITAKQAAIQEARNGLIGTDDPTEHKKIVAGARQKMTDIDAGGTEAPTAAPATHPFFSQFGGTVRQP